MQLARRPARVTDELQPIRDAVCLDAYNDLMPVGKIAEAIGKNRVTVWRWIKRARENPRPPDLTIWANDSGSLCRHRKLIVPGMGVLCIECWGTGMPNHPALMRGDPVGGVKTSEHQPDGTPKSKLASPSSQPNLKRRTRRK